jgi:hypothetical protein
MAYKTNKSPLTQFNTPIGAAMSQVMGMPIQNQPQQQNMVGGGFFGNLNTNTSQQNMNTGGFFGNLNIDTSGMLGNIRKLAAERAAKKAGLGMAQSVKNTQQMNPKATGNNALVKNVCGQEQVPGSYNRSMSPLTQMQEINPIYPPTTKENPLPPPAEVEQAIAPPYDLSNK